MATRNFDKARRQQGFRSQEHLNAFFEYYDHTCACPECQKPGQPVLVDDGYQPAMNRCDKARSLEAKCWAIADAMP